MVGHTHGARWKAEDALAFVNTGTWIHLVKLPPASASDAEWMKFLDSCTCYRYSTKPYRA